MRFRIPTIDYYSFFLGIILSSVFWWVISLLRPAFRQIRETSDLNKSKRKEKARAHTAVEEHYRQTVLLQAQGMHLSAPLFSLEEILQPCRLMAPPPRIEPGMQAYSEDIVEQTVPYSPEWPELAAFYNASTLSLAEALSGNSDIVLVGQSGSGKTVALADLASKLARRDPEPGLPPDTVPFLIQVADLDLTPNKNNPLNSLIEVIAAKASVFDLGRLPEFVQTTFQQGQALVLLDGTDELTPEGLKNVVEFIRGIKRAYPSTRMITTASSEYLDGLVSLNFIPFSLAAWNLDQKTAFLEKWGSLWEQHISIETWAQTNGQVDTLLLNGWLKGDCSNLTPLELTLKAWAAYAGDVSGSKSLDAIESHIRRLTAANTPRKALESLALEVTLAAEPIFDPHKAHQWIKSFEMDETQISNDDLDEVQNEPKKGKKDQPKAPSQGLISRLADSGLLIQHRNNRMRFIHPVFSGYLAGGMLENYTEAISAQSPWVGKYLAMQYLAARGDATQLAKILLAKQDRPLARNLSICARWLNHAPAQSSWKGQVLARLADLLRQNGQPLGLRMTGLSAFIGNEDSGTAVLLRQLLGEHDSELLQLAALGAGAIKDPKAVDPLVDLLNHPSPNVQRAACLALVAIGNVQAMDAMANSLLRGDENLRRSAAEALANDPGEGHKMLREGAAMKDDLAIRRAVAYGLGRIDQPWANEILNKLQLEDDQWVVRNAAMEMLEDRRKINIHIPRRIPPPSESAWLIAFASKQGIGISPDKPPTELLLLALKSAVPEERLASLSYLRMMPSEGVFGALYQAMYGSDPELREAVYQAVSEMAARGMDVPDPVQFGVGY